MNHSSWACVHHAFEAIARQRSDAIAVTCEDESVTYGALNAKANRLARYLQRCGVGPEVRVALCLDRSIDMVAAILAVLKAGGAYVPLDTAYPVDRLAFMLEDSGAALLLTQEHLAAGLSPSGLRTVLLEKLWSELDGLSVEDREAGPGPDNLAYIIYTSGSTGRPKGVMVTHRNLSRLMTSTEAWFHFGADDVWTLFHSYAFDFSVWEMWGAFVYGGRLVVIPFLVSRSPDSFRSLLSREKVTVLCQTPSAFRQLMQADAQVESPLALRYVIFGGEALELQTLGSWYRKYRDDRPSLINMYGITETTVHVTYRRLIAADAIAGNGSMIGVAIPDLGVHILDEELNSIRPGEVGEMYIEGAGLARGYLNRPGLTAERFVPSPFSKNPGARLYRSGDLARHSLSADIEYLGRSDFQVKIRGFRIETGEIEAALQQQVSVRDCVVIAREDAQGDKRLVAYLIPQEGMEIDASQLRETLKDLLPDYMVPSAFVAVERWPLTPNGKLDRKALPAPAQEAVARHPFVPPETDLERSIAAIWAEVLSLDRVGLHDNFFHLGGQSLLAVTMIAKLRAQCGSKLSLRELFEHPRLKDFAAAVLEATHIPLKPLVRVTRTKPVPASPGQSALWFMDWLVPSLRTYNIHGGLRFEGELDCGALNRALTELVRRHEVLRTIFVETAEGPLQRVLPPTAVELSLKDLTELPISVRDETLGDELMAAGLGLFDLAVGPLIRFTLWRLSPTQHVLGIDQHHSITDERSETILVEELCLLYEAFVNGEASPLAEPLAQYGDYSAWQADHSRETDSQRDLAYWTQKLKGQQILNLPTDFSRPQIFSFHGDTLPFMLANGELLAQLEAIAADRDATLFMLMHAAFALVLSTLAGQDDVSLGTPVSWRTHPQTERMLGYFVNTVVLRLVVKSQERFSGLLEQSRVVTLEAYEHQEVTFDQVVRAVRPRRDPSRHPLYQHGLSLLSKEGMTLDAISSTVGVQPPIRLGALSIREQRMKCLPTARYDLHLWLKETPAGLSASFEYATDLFAPATIEGFADALRLVLQRIASNPDASIEEIAAAVPRPARSPS